MSRCHSDVILGEQPSQSTVAPVSGQASHCRCQTRTGGRRRRRPAASVLTCAARSSHGPGGAAPAPRPSVCPQAPPGRAPAVWRCCPSPCVPHVVGIEQAAESPTVSVRRRARLAVPSRAVAPTGGLFGSSLHGDSRRGGWEPPPVLDASASEAAGSPGVWGGSCSLGPGRGGLRCGRRCVRRGRAVQVVADQAPAPRVPACRLTALGVGVASRFSTLVFVCIINLQMRSI